MYRRVPKLRYTFSVRPVHLWWTGLLTPFWLCQNGVYLNFGTSTKAGLVPAAPLLEFVFVEGVWLFKC